MILQRRHVGVSFLYGIDFKKIDLQVGDASMASLHTNTFRHHFVDGLQLRIIGQ
jgi:hypothetical protein